MPVRAANHLFPLAALLFVGCADDTPACESDDGNCASDSDSTESDTRDGEDTAFAEDTAGRDTADRDSEDTEKPPVNLLLDPGFELDDGSWNIWGGAARVEAEGLNGTWALRATATNGAEQLVRGLTPNTVYRLSGWAKTEGTEPVLIGVKDHGGAEVNVAFTDAAYHEDGLTFTTGLSNTEAVIYVYKHAEDAQAHADDLVLIEEGPSSRTPIWSDEFDGSGALDAGRWTHESGFVRNEELQWYQSDNAFQEDGFLVIEGRTDDRPNPDYDPTSSDWRDQRETIEYTSASVTTMDLFSFQYGTLVVRAKLTNETGTWPAIWTLGTSCEWPSNGEIDVMENYGGDILANFAWGTDTRWSAAWDASRHPVADFGDGWTDDFHIWELQWTASSMSIRLDGQLLNDTSLSDTINGAADCAGQNPFQQPHYVLLNLALGSNGGSVDALEFPTRYLIDYVRVYAPE